ncbi:hypothetical protein QQ045_019009 [Rhodiola kirilowii]
MPNDSRLKGLGKDISVTGEVSCPPHISFPFKQRQIRTDIDHNEFSAICYVRDYMFDHFQLLKNISLDTQSYSSQVQPVRSLSSGAGTFILQGNIIRWMKKEGDKVSLGEVLCEVETDQATVEMECMEEGYLSKIVIAITVEGKKRKKEKKKRERRKRIYMDDLVIKDAALALKKVPQCNSSPVPQC